MLTHGAVMAAASLPQLAFHEHARVGRADVSLADVADIKSLPAFWRARAEQVVVASMAAGCAARTFSITQLARVARARLPGISPWLRDVTYAGDAHDSVVVELEPCAMTPTIAIDRSPRARTCQRVARAVVIGEAIKADDLDDHAFPCDHEPDRLIALSSDARVAIAARSLQASDVIFAIPPTLLARARRGDTLTSRVVVGSVSISRETRALRAEPVGRTDAPRSPLPAGGSF
jgi:hypothetical protein